MIVKMHTLFIYDLKQIAFVVIPAAVVSYVTHKLRCLFIGGQRVILGAVNYFIDKIKQSRLNSATSSVNHEVGQEERNICGRKPSGYMGYMCDRCREETRSEVIE